MFSSNIYHSKYDAYSGVMTASVAKPVGVNSVFSNGLEPFTLAPKAVLFTQYAHGTTTLHLLVVNVHEINFQLDIDKFQEQLRFITDIVKRHDGPVIFAGDFNTWNENRLHYLRKVIREMNLQPIDFGSDSVHIMTKFGKVLDHIFYRETDLEVVKESEDVLKDVNTSDHKPLFAGLRVRQQNRQI